MTTQGSTFRFRVALPLELRLEGRKTDREGFFDWAWAALTDAGLIGVHEGTMLSEQAAESGLETESWTIDSGEAPRERDWVSHQKIEEAELYFSDRASAEAARARVRAATGIEPGAVDEQLPQDWDAEWKKSFQGAQVPPFWDVIPPFKDVKAVPAGRVPLIVNPGAGFGTGTHETTQLCLRAVGELCPNLRGARVLDFGSGSGILAIAAARLGARVDAVEIDPLAIENAEENARLNGVEGAIEYSRQLASGGAGVYRLVFANILRPVLLQFAGELCRRVAPGGTIILSGLMQPDVAEVIEAYSAQLGGRRPLATRELGEWRALVWSL